MEKVQIIKKGILFEKKDGKLLKLTKLKERYLLLTSDLLNCFKVERRKDDNEMRDESDEHNAEHGDESDESHLANGCAMGEFLFSIKLNKMKDKIKLVDHLLFVDHFVFTSSNQKQLQHWFQVLNETCIRSNQKRQSLIEQQQQQFMKQIVNKKQQHPFYNTCNYSKHHKDQQQQQTQYSTIAYSSRLTPILAPQCKGKTTASSTSVNDMTNSAITTRRTSTMRLMATTPHSLLISPSLTQRSLYAQQILSSSSSSSRIEDKDRGKSGGDKRLELKSGRLLFSPSTSLLALKCGLNDLCDPQTRAADKSSRKQKMKSASNEFAFIKLNSN
ncbi:hypothetical protein B4U79_16593 [Dinothrombium tinctorium]|uniref:PH domain-containing protein n=1 Tax=Dinothrombium tinctorium TaxID=1965070 RepID=A0A3S3SKS7_9ACAR|nr:hypothetical protein B4U79_17306 [Dinothrombium tinctorium]RWS16569.1 hypothetical protein B4U79_16613 [Dinothrombium tinctorium]RWS16584.1 hypothetical protein B4U79_16593 [Dinothrombium tinctorium]